MALQGLQPLEGYVNPDPEATPEERLGEPADPRHGELTGGPYPWEAFPGEPHGPYGLDNQLIGGADIVLLADPAGQLAQDPTADLQPVTHAAPWPKGIPQGVGPDETADWNAQLAGIHAENFGADRAVLYDPGSDPVQDNWRDFYDVDPGQSVQDPSVPGQVKASAGGWGNTDRVQSFAKQNEYGFDSAHLHRRYAAGSIPGNYMWMRPGSRPMVVDIPGTAVTPVGPDSPFYGQDPSIPFNTQGAALTVLPAEYQAPPDPALAATFPAEGTPGVDLW